ncbi:MAG: hypothetical protein L3J24_00060 [Xanthomonadales bacterium]|nr:hypothetical protein [Xanthomonadales bacterium]
MSEKPADYFKRYRQAIGFTSQMTAKQFLSGKDVSPEIDFAYIDKLNHRLCDIINAINDISDASYKLTDIAEFTQNNIYSPYKTIKDAGLIPRLNNQGRRPESVLFSWLRGYMIVQFFTPLFSNLFSANMVTIGDDDLCNIETFRRSPKADLEFTHDNQCVRIEVQSGFQGINDIKEHKVREAHRIFKTPDNPIKTICIHLDIFNGQVAFVQLDKIQTNDANFVTRQQMEGQSVLAIDQNYFKWRLLDSLPEIDDLELSL